jgi:uncharacterized radical SAM superfamily Fe-S cluster-containing enzyme
MNRRERAEAILQSYRPGEYVELGAGFSGVVFRDDRWVYKVHVPLSGSAYGESDHLMFLKEKLGAFRGTEHFFELRALDRHQETHILVYPYEPSEPPGTATEEEWLSFLTEMWERKFICRSISLATNFVRVGGVLKLIDYEIEPYDDNLFVNVAARAFVQLEPLRATTPNYAKLKRSLINQFDLPEAAGFWPFLARVFRTIAHRQRPAVSSAPRGADLPGPELTVADVPHVLERTSAREVAVRLSLAAGADVRDLGLMALERGWTLAAHRVVSGAPRASDGQADLDMLVQFVRQVDPPQPVSLLIKACIQDTEFLDLAVRHLVRQFSGPERFTERVLLLDLYRNERFLRQFSARGTAAELLEKANRLVDARVIDRVLVAPADEVVIRGVNRRWFGLDSPHTHNVDGVPVVSQLYGFESMATDRILQTDLDALVGVRDAGHRYLSDMLQVLDAHPGAVSAGFQICQPESVVFQPHFGFEHGGFVPEVRCCLLSRERLQALCPLPNTELAGGLARTWYRAVEAQQRSTGRFSVRGGSTARFFIHPQNYRKAAPSTWPALIDRVEKLAIPPVQAGNAEVVGTFLDWCLPKRGEDLVVVAVVEDQPPAEVCDFLLGLEAQDSKEFGVLLVDNSGRRRAGWLVDAVAFDRHRVTVIDRHERVTKLAALHEAIQQFVTRDDTWVCLLEPDDTLLGGAVLSEALARLRLYGADLLVGKEISEATLGRAGKHAVDFVEPRRKPLLLRDGLFVFRRSLFDSLDLHDLRARCQTAVATNTYKRLSRSHAWHHDPSQLSVLVPIAESCVNPVRFDFYNVLRRRSPTTSADQEVAAFLRTRPRKAEGAVLTGRKVFLPNLERIELDITYDCNLKCINCNRSCTQSPTSAAMSLDQVRAFAAESVGLGKRWDVINVLGGEPTLHPEFQQIVRILLDEYVDVASPDTTVQVTSNGHGTFVQGQLAGLPKHPRLLVNDESFKASPRVPYFTPFNDAPVDDPAFEDAEFSRGCWVTAYCGIGLNHLGYFACAVAGGIERVLGTGRGVQRLADVDLSIRDTLDKYCRLCGNFKHSAQSRGDFVPRSHKDACTDPVLSPTWRRLYDRT